MAPPDAEVVTPVEPEVELRQLFGDYKAEWLRNRLFDLFAEPAYFPSLEGARPCFLMGGRGTGKTTVLKGLSHLGTYHLSKRGKHLAEWEYVGLYYRVNSNRVAPFRGPELSAEQWDKVFAHYINLTLADLLLEFVEWSAESLAFSPEVPESEILNIGISLGLAEQPTSLASLRVAVASASARFE